MTKQDEATDDVGAPFERHVRPLRWLCNTCGWNGADAELLRAPSPFDAADAIVGCPKCRAVNDVENACDEPGCDMPATCGFPAPGGYRRTCGKHLQWWDERPNVRGNAHLTAAQEVEDEQE